MEGWRDGGMEGWIEGRKEGWMDGWMQLEGNFDSSLPSSERASLSQKQGID